MRYVTGEQPRRDLTIRVPVPNVMSDLSPQEIKRIAGFAALAALRVDDESLPLLAREIARIIEYVSQLREADVDPAEADHTWLAADPPLPPRDDAVRPPMRVMDPGRFAPAYDDGLFVVPRLAAMEDE